MDVMLGKFLFPRGNAYIVIIILSDELNIDLNRIKSILICNTFIQIKANTIEPRVSMPQKKPHKQLTKKNLIVTIGGI